MKRIAIVGLGKMGILHASLINAMQDARVVAITDKQKGLKNQLRGIGINAVFYDSLEELLKNASIDAVFACVPSSVNVHIAKKIFELGQSSGIRNGVGYSVAYMPIFAKASDVLKTNVIGKISSVKSKAYLSAVFSKQNTWQYRKQVSGGGCIMAIGSHLLFIMSMLFGQPTKVSKSKLNYKYNEVEDEAEFILGYNDGFNADVVVSWSIPGYQNTLFEIEIEGTKGKMTVNNNEILIYPEKRKEPFKIHAFQLKDNAHFNLGGPGYGEQDFEFVKSLFGKATPKATWKEGLHIQQIISAIYECYEKKTPIMVE